MSATRHLYLARHAEADPDHGGLSATGERQAHALGRRLAALAPHTLHRGPSARARATAHTVSQHLPGIQVQVRAEAGDLIPHAPTREEPPSEHTDRILDFVQGVDGVDEPDLTRAALERFTDPCLQGPERREAVITHAFTAGFQLAHALGAPAWRWVSLAPAHASLTVIRYPHDAPASPTVYNDLAHLPEELRWSGFPHHLRP